MGATAKTDAQIDRQASDWLVRTTAGDMTAGDRRAFDAWLAADPAHRAAYREMERLWGDIAQMDHLAGQPGVDTPLPRERALAWIRRAGALAGPGVWRPALAAAAVLVVALFWAGLVGDQDPGGAGGYATQVAEIRDVALPDGSLVTLGGRSAIALAFSAEARRVELRAGEAFFAVAHDPGRPFVVAAGDTVVRVVGTKFDMHRGPERVRVTVVEGIVEVTKAEPGPEAGGAKQVLKAGQQIVSAHDAPLAPVRAAPAAEPVPWRVGRLVYDDVSLAEVVADANRYYAGEIVFGAEELRRLKITASFRTDEIDRMISTLEVALPVSARRAAGGRIILNPRSDDG